MPESPREMTPAKFADQMRLIVARNAGNPDTLQDGIDLMTKALMEEGYGEGLDVFERLLFEPAKQR